MLLGLAQEKSDSNSSQSSVSSTSEIESDYESYLERVEDFTRRRVSTVMANSMIMQKSREAIKDTAFLERMNPQELIKVVA